MKIIRFEDMEAWKNARTLAVDIYRISSAPGFSKDRGLQDQIRRASVSIMANLAEGFASGSRKDFSRYVGYALASAAEVKSHIYLALDLDYLASKSGDELLAKASIISMQLTGLQRYLKSSGVDYRATP